MPSESNVLFHHLEQKDELPRSPGNNMRGGVLSEVKLDNSLDTRSQAIARYQEEKRKPDRDESTKPKGVRQERVPKKQRI